LSSGAFCKEVSPGVNVALMHPPDVSEIETYDVFMSTLDQAVELGEFLVKLATSAEPIDTVTLLHGSYETKPVGMFKTSIDNTSWRVSPDPDGADGMGVMVAEAHDDRFWMPEDSMRELGRTILALAMPGMTHCSRIMQPSRYTA